MYIQDNCHQTRQKKKKSFILLKPLLSKENFRELGWLPAGLSLFPPFPSSCSIGLEQHLFQTQNQFYSSNFHLIITSTQN